MRVVKEAEVRRNEILDVAQDLFVKKGYELTSTNDILERVGIARGTLYYHFKTKEEILDCLIERLTSQLITAASVIAEDKKLPILERLSKTIISLNVSSPIGDTVMEQIHQPQNAMMHQKMQDRMLTGILPVLTKLVEEGISAGVFHTDHPVEAIEMTMMYVNNAFDQRMELSKEQMQNKIQGFIYNVEKLFGTHQGELQGAIMKIFQASENN